MPSTKTRIPALATTNGAPVPASCQLAEHPTDVSDDDDGIGYIVNPSQSSKLIPRDDGAISFEPIRNLSTVTTKPVSNNPSKCTATNWSTHSRENHQPLQDLSTRQRIKDLGTVTTEPTCINPSRPSGHLSTRRRSHLPNNPSGISGHHPT